MLRNLKALLNWAIPDRIDNDAIPPAYQSKRMQEAVKDISATYPCLSMRLLPMEGKDDWFAKCHLDMVRTFLDDGSIEDAFLSAFAQQELPVGFEELMRSQSLAEADLSSTERLRLASEMGNGYTHLAPDSAPAWELLAAIPLFSGYVAQLAGGAPGLHRALSDPAAFTAGVSVISSLWSASVLQLSVPDFFEERIEGDLPDGSVPVSEIWHDIEEILEIGRAGNDFLDLIRSLPPEALQFAIMGDENLARRILDACGQRLAPAEAEFSGTEDMLARLLAERGITLETAMKEQI